jgi:hypothetical protein
VYIWPWAIVSVAQESHTMMSGRGAAGKVMITAVNVGAITYRVTEAIESVLQKIEEVKSGHVPSTVAGRYTDGRIRCDGPDDPS